MSATAVQTAPTCAENEPQLLPLDRIKPPSNPINDINWEHVNRLAAGYERGDPIPPITVFPIEDRFYETVFGQHRVPACKRGGKTNILAIVLPTRPSSLEILALQFRENNDHRELNGLERATAFFRAKEIGKLSNKAVAQLFGVSEATVSRDLQVSESLHPTLKAIYAKLELCPKPAWALSRLPSELQVSFYEQNKGLKAEGVVDAVNDKLAELNVGKAKATKKVPIKLRTKHGITIIIPADLDFDTALTDLAVPQEVLKRAQKQGLPFATVPILMRTQATT